MASKDPIPDPPSTTEPANPAIRDAPIETKPAAAAAGETKKPKTEKELKKEREKAEKAAKFAEKKARQEAAKKAAGPSKKEKKKAVEIVEYVEETKPGDKKILKSLEDPAFKAYNPHVVESAWYAWWEKEGFFEPELTPEGKPKPEGMFVLPAPPPNVTGALHMGHALTVALQDTLARWYRMKGHTVLWVPGFDHAGIATQSVVEKMVAKTEGKTRYDYGREEFLKIVWKWKEQYHQRIKNQQKLLGGSFDWTREAFTMDENLSKAVRETFVRLHEEGIIYRANRLVNWCVQLKTAISNLEVDNLELEKRTFLSVPGYTDKVEFGVLTSFAYEIEGSDEKIVVATTRPETMLGDTAVAVHPSDERYKHLVGKKAKHPFVDRLMPIIADDYVEKDFGTGCVKITPAHDPNDFAMGQRHNLEFINLLNQDGTYNENAGPYQGMKRFDIRKKIVEDLKARDLFVGSQSNPMKIPLCSRSKDVIEPFQIPQWWVNQKDLAADVLECYRKGELKITPAICEKDFLHWFNNIQDWCISRQLWWGHQIPAYFIQFPGDANDEMDESRWVAAKSDEEAHEKAKAKFPGKEFTLRRDEDVLDTWFSSGLWPFSILGWPEKTLDMENFYPTSMLETGWDILFFWVARMLMLGKKLTGKLPFNEVLCHPLVRDSEGRKMSKSLGNVVDPVDVINGITLDELQKKLLEGNLAEKDIQNATKYQKTAFPDGIPQCGADAMHFAMCAYYTGGRDINMDIRQVYGYRKFCNKIYQATKFALLRLGDDFKPQEKEQLTGKETLVEKWITNKYNEAAKIINKAIENREFSVATNALYNYWYYELCDVYIENSKPLILEGSDSERQSARETLYTCLEGALRLVHPFMPFLTEELWQRLPRRETETSKSISKAKFPEFKEDFVDDSADRVYGLVLSVVKAVRSITAEYNILADVEVYVQALDKETFNTVTSQTNSISALIKGISFVKPLEETGLPEKVTFKAISKTCNVYVNVKDKFDAATESKKLSERLSSVQDAKTNQEKTMAQEEYGKVQAAVQEADKERIAEWEAEMLILKGMLKKLELA